MESIISQYSRLSHHTITDGGTFSVPAQEDFTLKGVTGSWTKYDLALSEIGVDELNKKAFIRIDDEIKEFQLGTSSGASQSLYDTLLIGNSTLGEDIIMATGSLIKSDDSNSIVSISNDGIEIVADERIIETSYEYVIVNGLYHRFATASTGSSGSLYVDPTYIDVDYFESGGSFEVIAFEPFSVDGVRFFEAYVTGVNSDNSKGYFNKITAVVRRNGVSIGIIGAVDEIERSDFSSAGATIDVDGYDVRVVATGESGEDISWSCKLIYSNDTGVLEYIV